MRAIVRFGSEADISTEEAGLAGRGALTARSRRVSFAKSPIHTCLNECDSLLLQKNAAQVRIEAP